MISCAKKLIAIFTMIQTLLLFFDFLNLALSYSLVLVRYWLSFNVMTVKFFWLAIGYCDWGHQACSLSIEWGGVVDGHMGPGEIFELGEVNAYEMCASATNKQ